MIGRRAPDRQEAIGLLDRREGGQLATTTAKAADPATTAAKAGETTATAPKRAGRVTKAEGGDKQGGDGAKGDVLAETAAKAGVLVEPASWWSRTPSTSRGPQDRPSARSCRSLTEVLAVALRPPADRSAEALNLIKPGF